MKTLYETLGGTYREENGRLIPEMKLPEQTNYQIGKYGQFYLDYIKNHRQGTPRIYVKASRGLGKKLF